MLVLALEPAALRMIFPFSILSFPTLMASAPGAPGEFDAAAGAGLLPGLFAGPRPQKFHVPFEAWIRLTSGSFTVSERTSSFFEKISGSSSTPTLKDLVVKNGDFLNAGSSAIETSVTVTPPEKIERLISPIPTGRPSAVANCVSSVGLNWLALTKSGRARTITNNSTTTAPIITRGFFFMASLQKKSVLQRAEAMGWLSTGPAAEWEAPIIPPVRRILQSRCW